MLYYPIENKSNLLCSQCVYTDLQSILYIHIYTHFTNTIKTRRTLTNKQIQVTTGYKQQHEQQEQLIAASAVYQINCACKSTFHRVGT